MINKLWVLVITLLLLGGGNVWATVSGPCSECHTMHNSQDGGTVQTDLGRSLTKGDCIGCHTGVNVTDGNTPFITNTSKPTYGPDYDSSGVLVTTPNTLAGGTFYYVATATAGIDGCAADATGHNVKGLRTGDDSDATITTDEPPGWVTGWGTSGIATGNAWSTNQLTCAGTYGCHGSHSDADDFADIRGSHHGDDSVINGSTTIQSYRFLKGIIGFEDDDWEFTVDYDDHNQYFGNANTNESEVIAVPTLGSAAGRGISAFCGTCHGNFHSGNAQVISDGDADGADAIGTSPWLRHPTDYALKTAVDNGASPEYSAYSGTDGTAGNYNPIAPVATSKESADSTVSSTEVVKTSVATSADTSIVTCLSCHRAHGSPYADLLRWNYTSANMEAGTTATEFDNKGCFICHSSKD